MTGDDSKDASEGLESPAEVAVAPAAARELDRGGKAARGVVEG